MIHTLFGLLPKQGAPIAGKVDASFWFVFWLSLFFFLLIQGFLVYFVLRYRKNRQIYPYRENPLLEVFWTAVPLLLVIGIFFSGWRVFQEMHRSPKDAYEIQVQGKQWVWIFTYPDGRTTVNELAVPAGKPVKLVMTSEDVIHSLYIPEFRLKQDVVPNLYTTLWFQTQEPDTYKILCAEYCGASHSGMLATLLVLPEDRFQAWLAASPAPSGKPPAEWGAELFVKKGCNACHSTDGTPGVGPSLKGVFGHEVLLSTGEKVIADENYLRESILSPQAKVVAGFTPVMPTFKGILTDEEINALIAYIKSLK